MKLRKLIPLALIAMTLGSSTAVAETNYEEKLPYMFKEPNWERYKHGDQGAWPLPKVPDYSTGIYSTASNNAVDYKEDRDKFFETAAKYKSSDNLEVYFKSNPSTSVTMALPFGTSYGKTVGGDTTVEFKYSDTNVPAYNNVSADDQLILDSSQGQWLVTNGYYSRDNLGDGVSTEGVSGGVTLTADVLESNPWGLTGSATYITPEDFLMGLSKSVYGVIQSRPVYLQTTPYRLARKVTWSVTNYCPSIIWTYQTDEFQTRDVSYINPAWADLSPPACGQTKIIDRGEYIVHPEGYLNNVWYRYNKDQNSYVSPNVYELYFSKLLQKGILNTDNAFANASPTSTFTPDPANKATNFSFTKSYADKFFKEYQEFGNDVNGTSKYKYPIWGGELGALYSNRELVSTPLGTNITDKSIEVTNSGGATLFEKVLGARYSVRGSASAGATSIKKASYEGTIMAKNTVTVINALQMIERAMRVEDGDMSITEAAIITKKYGAQYLDKLSDADKQTVSYLLAKGVLNFENYQEYSNLYSPLSASFAYKLMYRIANVDARLGFTEVTLTDSSDIPANFSEYKQTIIRADFTRLNNLGSVNSLGTLIKNNGLVEKEEKLTLLSDIVFMNDSQKLEGNPTSKIGTRYVITADIDDPLKYLYRSMPLINVDAQGKPLKIGGTFKVYTSNEKKLYNDVLESAKRYVGIRSIDYDSNSKRYKVVFYAYGDSYDTALRFIKANLHTRIGNVSESSVESSVISNTSGALSATQGSDLNTSISSNNDLVINKDFDLSAYSNDIASIVGNNVVMGASSVKVGDTTMASVDLITKLTNNTAFEKVGDNSLVTLDTSQLKGRNTYVQSPSGETVGKTTIIKDKVNSIKTTYPGVVVRTPVPFENIEVDLTAFNLSMLNSADTLMSTKEFEYTDNEGKKRFVTGNIIVSWEIDLPSESEQASIIGKNVTPYINDSSKSSWLFTKPQNEELLKVWDFNVGLNNSILKTLTGNDLNIPSGYFAPKIDILIDSLNTITTTETGKTYYKDLNAKQLLEIENKLTQEIGNNLSSNWTKKYVGNVALANHIAGEPNKELDEFFDKSKSTNKYVYVKPSGLLVEGLIPKERPVWYSLVFNRESRLNETTSYFDHHSTKSTLEMHSIYSAKEGNRYYGELFVADGEGMTSSLSIPFVQDNFSNIYRNEEYSNYRYDEKTSVLREQPGPDGGSKSGRTVKYKDETWIVQDETEYTINLFSTKFITGTIKGGQVFQSSGGDVEMPPILDAIHEYNLRMFGKGQETGIDSKAFMRTQAFDFTSPQSVIAEGKKFISVKNSTMTPVVYTAVVNAKGDSSIVLEKAKMTEGDVVQVPAFVTLSKSVWSVTGGNLYWSKKFVGAEESAYNKGSLIQIIKEQLLEADSPNIVEGKTVKTGTLKVGSIEGVITNGGVTFAVPFKSEMLLGKELNKGMVIDEFNLNSELTITDKGDTASAAQYLINKEVGYYDPHYKKYNNTLVLSQGELKVVTGDKLINYSPNSVVESVSLRAIVMDGVRFLNYGANSSSGVYKIYQYQPVKPPALVSPFTNGAPPLVNAENVIIADVASEFTGIPTADELFDSLERYLKEIAARSMMQLILMLILSISLALSITTLLAHVFAHTPISNVFFERLLDITGIDFLSIASIGTVRITGEPPNGWVRTAKTSFFLGVIPIVVFGVMRVYGLL